jgi:signal transduction histidine kinase
LGVLVLAALVPLLVFAVLIVRQDVGERQEILDRGMRDTAQALTLAIDGEVKAAMAILQTLAASPLLDSADLKSFHELGVRAMQAHSGAYVILFDATGRPLANSSRPYGADLPNPLLAARPVGSDPRYPEVPLGGADPVRRVVETGKPVISDLFISLVTRGPRIGLDMPVLREGRLRYVLEMSIDAGEFTRLLAEQRLPANSVLAILDRKGLAIARSLNAESRVGRRLAPELSQQVAASDKGSGMGRTAEGMPVYHAFTRSQLTGWTTSLSVSKAVALAPQARQLAVLAGGAALALLLGLAVAVFIGGRISRPLARLAGSANAMARGENAALDVGGVRELRDLYGALADAGGAARQAASERERRLLAEENERALKEADRHKDEFLAMLSHELRNPLAALTAAAHVLKVAPDSAGAAKARGVVERQTEHMAYLIEDLLDISRVTMGKVVLQRETFDFAQAVSATLQAWRLAGRFDGRARLSLDASPAWVNADAARIEQILSNLLDNALKFTPADGSVEVSVREEHGEAVLRVADTGRGIGTELLPRVFDPFVQGERRLDRGGGGLGLGLALVKRLVELHGGSVSAQSEGDGRGASLTVRLPAVAAAPEAPPPTPRVEGMTRPRRILVIEDNADTREMLRAALAIHGHEVRAVADGAAGIAAAAEAPPEVALIDIGLPDIDGYEVARRLRAGAGAAPIGLIALTGYGQDEDQRRALESGFDAHLTKPVAPERLSKAIAALR